METAAKELWEKQDEIKKLIRSCGEIILKNTPSTSVIHHKEVAANFVADFDVEIQKILIASCHAKAYRYPVIKSWFLEQYPEIVKFGIEEDASIESPVTANVTVRPQSNELKVVENNTEETAGDQVDAIGA